MKVSDKKKRIRYNKARMPRGHKLTITYTEKYTKPISNFIQAWLEALGG